jgi:hypothetical protein
VEVTQVETPSAPRLRMVRPQILDMHHWSGLDSHADAVSNNAHTRTHAMRGEKEMLEVRNARGISPHSYKLCNRGAFQMQVQMWVILAHRPREKLKFYQYQTKAVSQCELVTCRGSISALQTRIQLLCLRQVVLCVSGRLGRQRSYKSRTGKSDSTARRYRHLAR